MRRPWAKDSPASCWSAARGNYCGWRELRRLDTVRREHARRVFPPAAGAKDRDGSQTYITAGFSPLRSRPGAWGGLRRTSVVKGRHMRKIWLLAAAAVGLAVPAADAACCYFSAKNADILQPAQKVFISWDPVKKIETFTVQPKFEGNALDFGMVIPTPSQPKLH